MAQRYLLSIDGGGIRGIIPALALLKLEQTTGRPARESFSFVAGTSTGALLASAVALGIPASQIVEIYKNRIGDIFKPGKPWNSVKRYTGGYMYDIDNLSKVLDGEFGKAAAASLNDSPIDILLTAKGLADGKPWYFVKDNPANARSTGHLRILDCAAASAAAPTYFNPFLMASAPVSGKLVDGGVGVTGNPVYQACVEAFVYSQAYRPEETTVISFGTGRFAEKSDPHTILDWLTWVTDTMLHAPQEQQSELVARHYSSATFYRLEPELPSAIDMDEIDKIGDLEETGKKFAGLIDWDLLFRGEDCAFRVKAPNCA
jgi:patatin-like phospholipase/acyl hydrolase